MTHEIESTARRAMALEDLDDAVTALTRARLLTDKAVQRLRPRRAKASAKAQRSISDAHAQIRLAEAAVLDAMRDIGD